jgi:hypothetical protein
VEAVFARGFGEEHATALRHVKRPFVVWDFNFILEDGVESNTGLFGAVDCWFAVVHLGWDLAGVFRKKAYHIRHPRAHGMEGVDVLDVDERRRYSELLTWEQIAALFRYRSMRQLAEIPQLIPLDFRQLICYQIQNPRVLLHAYTLPANEGIHLGIWPLVLVQYWCNINALFGGVVHGVLAAGGGDVVEVEIVCSLCGVFAVHVHD